MNPHTVYGRQRKTEADEGTFALPPMLCSLYCLLAPSQDGKNCGQKLIDWAKFYKWSDYYALKMNNLGVPAVALWGKNLI